MGTEGRWSTYPFWKRAADVLLSAVLLVLLAVPMLFLALLVRIDSEGPAIFRQTRLGRDLVPFTVLKFRTMRVGAPHDRPSAELSGKERERALTGVGRVLRRLSLDELPQLWNVLRGEMSLVGPRPLIPCEIGVHGLRRALGATTIRPGITGLAQISGRDERSGLEKAYLDGIYAGGMSLGMDLRVLVGTLKAVMTRRGSN